MADTVVLATSNGTGMGHLAREAATALAIGDRAEPVLFSLSQALPLVRSLGLRGEYCPSQAREFLPPVAWQRYLADRIVALVGETSAKVFAFDGAWPYHGLSYAREQLPDVAFVWVRRGMWRPGVNSDALGKRSMFDLVLEPGDLAASADRGATASCDDAVRIAPVTLLEQVRRLDGQSARAELGLDPERPAALVTLRTESPDEDTAAAAAVRAVLEDPNWQVALTRTPLTAAELGVTDDRVVPLRGVFPLARYLAAFDMAVTEAGYNSFHEMLGARVPAVLVPTRSAVTDDQHARARWAAGQGLALAAAEDDRAAVASVVRELLDKNVRVELAARCAELPTMSGASAAASTLADLAKSFDRHRFTAVERIEIARRKVRPLARSVLAGKRRSQPADVAAGRFPVRLVEAAGADVIGADAPVEDLLPARSSGYRRHREEIALRHYGERPG